MKTERICKTCSINKKLDEFHKDKYNKTYGTRPSCKECTNKKKSTKFITRGYDFLRKKCSGCKKELELINFNSCRHGKLGTKSQCRDCLTSVNNYPSKPKLYKKVCKTCNACKDIKYFRKNKSCKYGVESNCRSCAQIKEREVYNIRWKEDPVYRLSRVLRSRSKEGFKSKNFSKSTKTGELLGAEWHTIKEHMEKQFSEGMTWNNHGFGDDRWHIDHIIPLSSAKTEEEMKGLCHYSNLQPLWQKDNLSKSNKLNS